jgi:hypothetical protein
MDIPDENLKFTIHGKEFDKHVKSEQLDPNGAASLQIVD